MTKTSLYDRLDAAQGKDKAELIWEMPKRSVLSVEGYAYLLDILHSEENRLIKFVAARTIYHADSQRAPNLVEAVFLDVLKDAKSLAKDYKDIAPGWDAVDEATIGLTVIGVATNRTVEIVPVLLEVLDKYSGYNASVMAHALLSLAFRGEINRGGVNFEKLSQGISFQQFNTHQQEILKTIAVSSRAWRYGGNMAETMAYFSLPTSKDDFKQFCGIH